MRLGTAFAGIALITSVLALSAVSADAQTIAHAPRTAHAPAARPRFAVVCSGDVCIQTQTKVNAIATVAAWAHNVSFTGHFELVNGCGDFVANSAGGDKLYPSGGPGYTFPNVHWADCNDSWQIIGWQKIGTNDYSRVGTVTFHINGTL